MLEILVSSALICQFFENCLKDVPQPNNIYPLKCRKGELYVKGLRYRLPVEAKQEFEIDLRMKKAASLIKMLRLIDDQPLTVVFNTSNGWIKLKEVIITE